MIKRCEKESIQDYGLLFAGQKEWVRNIQSVEKQGPITKMTLSSKAI